MELGNNAFFNSFAIDVELNRQKTTVMLTHFMKCCSWAESCVIFFVKPIFEICEVKSF